MLKENENIGGEKANGEKLIANVAMLKTATGQLISITRKATGGAGMTNGCVKQ